MQSELGHKQRVETANMGCLYLAIGLVSFIVLASTGLLFPLLFLVVFGGGLVGTVWLIGYAFGGKRNATQTTDTARESVGERVPPFGPRDPWAK
jgi:hypothetical protein